MDLIDLPVWLSKADDNMQLYEEVFGAAKFRIRSANPLLQLKLTSTQPQSRRVVLVVQRIEEVLSVVWCL
jgi:hypothetical protein